MFACLVCLEQQPVPFHIRGLTDAFQPELEGVRFLGILVQVLKIPAQCPRAPGQPPAGAGIHVAGGWRTCFPACHNRLIVLQTPSVAPPELNRRATHAGTAPGRRQFRFAGAPRPWRLRFGRRPDCLFCNAFGAPAVCSAPTRTMALALATTWLAGGARASPPVTIA